MPAVLNGTTARQRGRYALVALFAAAVLMVPIPAASAAARNATILTPVAGAPTIAATTFDLGTVGYQQSEFFLSGTATSYRSAQPLTSDGRWTVSPGETAPYTTRVVVDRPVSPKRFNGTVVVEWLNVSGGLDAAPDWILAHDALTRDGYAWVGVSAQAVGLNATKAANPSRYAALQHPGDSFSYDMYSQAGAAVRADADQLLGGLRPRGVLGIGESQSAFRLVTYVNAVQPLARVYDGFLVHSRFGGGAPLSQSPLPNVGVPDPTRIRTDLDVPVLTFETESDVAFGFFRARQPDTRRLRTWEVAGTAHYDYYGLRVGFSDPGDGRDSATLIDALLHPVADPLPGLIECATPINSGPQHWVVQAAIEALDRWVRTGRAPSHARPLAVAASEPFAFALDRHGNVKGGIRTPHVDAPLATLSGVGQSGGSFCALFGTTVPFTAAQIAALYPTHRSFVHQWRAAVHDAVREGFILRADARGLVRTAAASGIGARHG